MGPWQASHATTVLLPGTGSRIVVCHMANEAGARLSLFGPFIHEFWIAYGLAMRTICPFCSKLGMAGDTCWRLLGGSRGRDWSSFLGPYNDQCDARCQQGKQ